MILKFGDRGDRGWLANFLPIKFGFLAKNIFLSIDIYFSEGGEQVYSNSE